MSVPDLVVVRCSRGKNQVVGPAWKVYRGPPFYGALKYAKATGTRRLFIISAKHGLIRFDKVIAPYNLLMGDPGSVTADVVRQQADELGLLGLDDVRGVLSPDYAAIARQVWPNMVNVLDGVDGFFERIAATRAAGEAAQAARE